jgi:glycyl-tRNA synthetase beta chain
VTWAAVSLADKLDSVVGMFTAGERPTGSRDPLGLRRQAQGAVKILVDLPELTGLDRRLTFGPLVAKAAEKFGGTGEAAGPLKAFLSDRLAYLLEQRGYDVRAVRAVMHGDVDAMSPLEVRRKLEALSQLTGSEALLGVGALLKRVKNISKGVTAQAGMPGGDQLTEPAEVALRDALTAGASGIRSAAARGDFKQAFSGIAALRPAVAKFFEDVMVMAEDQALRDARLQLVATLRDLILEIADLSEMAADT